MRPAARRCSPRSDSPLDFLLQQREQADQAASSQSRSRRAAAHKPVRDFVPVRGDAGAGRRSAEPRSSRHFSSTCSATASAVYAADGLTQAFADKPEISVVGRAHEASGLVRDDYYDWLKAAHDLAAAKDKLDFVVIMLGINDTAAAEGRRRYARSAQRQMARALRPAHRTPGRAVQARACSGRLGRPAADAQRPVQRAGHQAQRNLQGARRKGRRALYRHLGRVRRRGRRNTTPMGPISTARTPSCAPPTASISPRPARASSRNSSRPKSSGRSTRPSRRTTSPICRPTSSRPPIDINAQIRREMGVARRRPGAPAAGRARQAAGRPDPVADGKAAVARRRAGRRVNRAARERRAVERVLAQGAPIEPKPGRADDFAWPRFDASSTCAHRSQWPASALSAFLFAPPTTC